MIFCDKSLIEQLGLSIDLMDSLKKLIHTGDANAVAQAIADGEDPHYSDEDGYTAFVDAACSVADDVRPLFRVLFAANVDPNGCSRSGESALSVSSRAGNFEAVRVLLDGGADPKPLGWTPLHRVIALGTAAELAAALADVEQLVTLEDRDNCGRSGWLLAIQTGDVAKAKLILEQGVTRDARGRGDTTPLMYAIAAESTAMMSWLLTQGEDVDQEDEFDRTPLHFAAMGSLEAVQILIAAGAKVGEVVRDANNRDVVATLLAAGADPADLSIDSRRVLAGLGSGGLDLMTASREDFLRSRFRRYGSRNPKQVNDRYYAALFAFSFSS